MTEDDVHRRVMRSLFESKDTQAIASMYVAVVRSYHWEKASNTEFDSEWFAAWDDQLSALSKNDPELAQEVILSLAQNPDPNVRTEAYTNICHFGLWGRGLEQLEHLLWEVAPHDEGIDQQEIRGTLAECLETPENYKYPPAVLVQKLCRYLASPAGLK